MGKSLRVVYLRKFSFPMPQNNSNTIFFFGFPSVAYRDVFCRVKVVVVDIIRNQIAGKKRRNNNFKKTWNRIEWATRNDNRRKWNKKRKKTVHDANLLSIFWSIFNLTCTRVRGMQRNMKTFNADGNKNPQSQPHVILLWFFFVVVVALALLFRYAARMAAKVTDSHSLNTTHLFAVRSFQVFFICERGVQSGSAPHSSIACIRSGEVCSFAASFAVVSYV